MAGQRITEGTVSLLVLGTLLGVAAGLWIGAAIGGSSGSVEPVVGVEVVVTLPPAQTVPYELFAPPTQTPRPTASATSAGGVRPTPTATPRVWCPAAAGSICTAPPADPPTATPLPTWPGADLATPGGRYVMPDATPRPAGRPAGTRTP